MRLNCKVLSKTGSCLIRKRIFQGSQKKNTEACCLLDNWYSRLYKTTMAVVCLLDIHDTFCFFFRFVQNQWVRSSFTVNVFVIKGYGLDNGRGGSGWLDGERPTCNAKERETEKKIQHAIWLQLGCMCLVSSLSAHKSLLSHWTSQQIGIL